jgi:hypothetical protein
MKTKMTIKTSELYKKVRKPPTRPTMVIETKKQKARHRRKNKVDLFTGLEK